MVRTSVRTHVYQGVRNASFSENFTYVLNECSLGKSKFIDQNVFAFNPFLAVPILYPLKTQENQRFSGVFQRV